MSRASRLKLMTLSTAIACLGCGIVWYYVSPGWTVNRMKEAAAANDPDGVSAFVDYPMVRENLKADYKAVAVKDLVTGNAPAVEMMGTAIGLQMIDNVVDGLISKEGVRQMFDVGLAAKTSRMPFGLSVVRAELVRDSFDQFRLRNANGGALVFERRGLSWRLIAFRGPVGQNKKMLDTRAGDATRGAEENDEAKPANAGQDNTTFVDEAGTAIDDRAGTKPVMTAAWLVGKWAALPPERRGKPNDWCETEGVTFEAGGRFSEMELRGRYRTDGRSITYYDLVITNFDNDDEDLSRFDQPVTNAVKVIDANTINEDGAVLSRCKGD
ncbi:DUF2939 domain-containing protein [Sphingomonas montana]|uniref:DUF2939 domain-containing protein n=1 Tax=Sphingomonas montana TaxID=1843236 RepID=UPI0013EB8057|nr:DUF2939 domain-containing protein [Sphingomonas montana]